MPKSKHSSSNIGPSGFAWLLLAAAGTYFVVHTKSSRGVAATDDGGISARAAELAGRGIPALAGPVRRGRRQIGEVDRLRSGENCLKKAEIEDHCRSPLSTPLGSPLVMIASVSGAPYSEDNEYRRRLRYAILAGLSRQGSVPRDPEHLGFFWTRAVVADPQNRLPEVVPFEQFDRRTRIAVRCCSRFDEDVLDGSPLLQFDEFICKVLESGMHASTELKNPKVLGPEFSTTLKAMAREAASGSGSRELAPEMRRSRKKAKTRGSHSTSIVQQRPTRS